MQQKPLGALTTGHVKSASFNGVTVLEAKFDANPGPTSTVCTTGSQCTVNRLGAPIPPPSVITVGSTTDQAITTFNQRSNVCFFLLRVLLNAINPSQMRQYQYLI